MNIVLKKITKSFTTPAGKIEIFKDFSLQVGAGEFISILGPNGCGKSTLFNLIIGLDNDYEGEIYIDHVADRRAITAYMMQKDLLLPWKTVYQNIVVGLEIQHKMTSSTKEQVMKYLEQFGIVKLLNTYPARLSGGERQKVALIRTLMLDAEIMLLDEPFSSIDYNTRMELQAQIFSLAKERNKTVLLITHDIDEAIAVSDRAIILNKKPNHSFKSIDITFDLDKRSPVSVKQDPAFSHYFTQIWSLLPG